jgi:hypothetical protein
MRRDLLRRRTIFGTPSSVSRHVCSEDISSLFVGSREDTTGLSLTPNARLFGPTSSQTEVIDFVTRLASYTTMGLICFV